MPPGSRVGLSQIARLQGFSWGGRSGQDWALWLDGDTLFTDANFIAKGVTPWADVRAYGATGDGVTDDARAIQAAIDAVAAAGGGTVFLPEGNYVIRSQVRITSSNVHLIGAGSRATTITPHVLAAGPFFAFGDGSTAIADVSIRGVYIGHATVPTSGHTITFDKVTRALVEDVWINNTFAGIELGTAANPDDTSAVWLSRVKVVAASVATGAGLMIRGGAGIWVRDCHFNGTAGQGSTGIHVPASLDTAFFSDTLIETHDTGVRMGAASGAVGNVWLTNVVVDRSLVAGFYLETSGGTLANVFLTGCWVSGTAGSGTGTGIILNEASGSIGNVKLTGCYVTDVRRHGMSIGGTPTQVSVVGCTFSNGGAGTTLTYNGIDVGANVLGVVLIANTIEGADWAYGINLGSGTTGVVSANNLTGNGTGPLNDGGSATNMSTTRLVDRNVGVTPKRSYVIGPFTWTDMAASAADTGMQMPTTDTTTVSFIAGGMTMPRAGRVSALMVTSKAARTAGTATFKAAKNSVVGTLTAALDGTNTQFVTATQESGDAFAAGDRLSVRFTTDGSWAPTTSEFVAWLEVTET